MLNSCCSWKSFALVPLQVLSWISQFVLPLVLFFNPLRKLGCLWTICWSMVKLDCSTLKYSIVSDLYLHIPCISLEYIKFGKHVWSSYTCQVWDACQTEFYKLICPLRHCNYRGLSEGSTSVVSTISFETGDMIMGNYWKVQRRPCIDKYLKGHDRTGRKGLIQWRWTKKMSGECKVPRGAHGKISFYKHLNRSCLVALLRSSLRLIVQLLYYRIYQLSALLQPISIQV